MQLHQPSTLRRECYSCGSTWTKPNGAGRPSWFLNRGTDFVLCAYCYDYVINRDEHIARGNRYRAEHREKNRQLALVAYEKRKQRLAELNITFYQYWQIHEWVRRNKPRPDVCESCGIRPPRDLSSKDGISYDRDIDLFYWHCRPCHMRHDVELGNRPQWTPK